MDNKLFRVFIALLLGLSCGVNNVCIAGEYYAEHAVGWHWYDDTKEMDESKNPEVGPTKNDPNAVVNNARKKITTALNKAIAEPTIENVENFIALQEQANDQAEKMATVWEQVLLKNPKLNYSFKHPTNNVALQVYHEQESIEKDKAIKQFAKQTGLLFFYKSTCTYCKKFAPILKNFAERNGVSVIPITLDGISLPEFPDSKQNSGQAVQFHVTVTPSLFAVNPYTGKAYPVAYGLISETELRDNIYKIMTKYQEGSI